MEYDQSYIESQVICGILVYTFGQFDNSEFKKSTSEKKTDLLAHC